MAEQTLKPLSNIEISAFCSQMSMILMSGISAMEGITLMLQDAVDSQDQALLKAIEEGFSNDGSLHTALESTKAFPSYMLQMVEIGENAGKLDDVMKSLAQHYDRENALSQTIKNAVLYPLIMVVMMLAVIIILITKVMPIFNQVYRQLGSEMSGISKGILNLGTILNRYAISFTIVMFVIVLWIAYFAFSSQGRKQAAALLSHFKWYKNYRHELSVCRFADGMSLMLGSGMMVEEAMTYSAKLTADADFENKVAESIREIEAGEKLSTALINQGIFSGLYARLLSIGTATGTADEAMRDIADKQLDEIDASLTNKIAVLEPTLVIVLSLIVGLILLSVMLPLMGVMSNL